MPRKIRGIGCAYTLADVSSTSSRRAPALPFNFLTCTGSSSSDTAHSVDRCFMNPWHFLAEAEGGSLRHKLLARTTPHSPRIGSTQSNAFCIITEGRLSLTLSTLPVHLLLLTLCGHPAHEHQVAIPRVRIAAAAVWLDGLLRRPSSSLSLPRLCPLRTVIFFCPCRFGFWKMPLQNISKWKSVLC